MSSWLFSWVPNSKALLGPLSFTLRLGCTSWLFPLVTPSLLPTEIVPPSPAMPLCPSCNTAVPSPPLQQCSCWLSPCNSQGRWRAPCGAGTPLTLGAHQSKYTLPCPPAYACLEEMATPPVCSSPRSILLGGTLGLLLSFNTEGGQQTQVPLSCKQTMDDLQSPCSLQAIFWAGLCLPYPQWRPWGFDINLSKYKILTHLSDRSYRWLQHCEWVSVTQRILLCVISHWNQLKCNFLIERFWSGINRSAKSKANHKILTTESLFLATHVRAAQQIRITVQYQRERQKLCIFLQRAHKGLGTACATARHCLWRWWQEQWHQECRNWPKLLLLSDHAGRMGSQPCVCALRTG